MSAVSTANAAHYVWGQQCDGWHLLAGDDLSVIEERMPPGTAEVRHRHARSRQFFYVLGGTAMLELEGVAHHVVRALTMDVRDEADPAAVVLVGGVVQTARGWRRGSLDVRLAAWHHCHDPSLRV